MGLKKRSGCTLARSEAKETNVQLSTLALIQESENIRNTEVSGIYIDIWTGKLQEEKMKDLSK
jgi:hypothetical protein